MILPAQTPSLILTKNVRFLSPSYFVDIESLLVEPAAAEVESLNTSKNLDVLQGIFIYCAHIYLKKPTFYFVAVSSLFKLQRIGTSRNRQTSVNCINVISNPSWKLHNGLCQQNAVKAKP